MRSTSTLRIPRALVYTTALVILLVGSPLHAETAGGFRGVVRSADGDPLQGATVVVSGPALPVAQGSISDAKGEFRIAPLPPGRGYSIRVTFPGMATVVVPDGVVTPGQVTAVDVTLVHESSVREQVRIVARPSIVNTDTTTTETDFTSEVIDALPIIGRNYQDVVTLAPGVSDVDGDGNPNIHGARDTDVVTLVDGVSTVDPLTGKVGQQLNIESIQEIEVKTSGASAEFGRGQGGFVQIMTKSGGNEFEGNFKFYWRGHALDGDGAGIDDPRLHGGTGALGLRDLEFNDFLPFLSLSGPLKKDRAWFYVTGEYVQIEDPVNALTQAFVRGTKETRVFGKLSWDLAANQKLVFSVTYDPQEYDNLGIDSLTALESGYTERAGGTNLVLRHTSIINPNVFLETTVQDFRSIPRRIPTIGPDTNGNGILWVNLNDNGENDARERDPGEDWDNDGAWDVFEPDQNRNGKLEPYEDADHDGRRTASGFSFNACEGNTREDYDCDGHYDIVDEDKNHNNILDPGEDKDGDHHLDGGIRKDGTPWVSEDHNLNGELDDRPFPKPTDIIPVPFGAPPSPPNYPYDTFVPSTRDRDWHLDYATGRTDGPNFLNYDREVGRVTLRQDLTVFIPSWHGQHDLKIGGVVERETYNQTAEQRQALFTHDEGRTVFVDVKMPTQDTFHGEAESTNFGLYLSDTYKPAPNLTLGFGMRFDRETAQAPGFTPVDAEAEGPLYRRLFELSGGEFAQSSDIAGDVNGVISGGVPVDPIFDGHFESNPTGNPVIEDLDRIRQIASSRLTQHHHSAILVAQNLQALFPGVLRCEDPERPETCVIDRDKLREAGASTFQEEELLRLTNNNLAPRMSISWDPWSDSKSKAFANWGRYYDKLFLQAIAMEQGPDTMARFYSYDPDGLDNKGIPDAGIGGVISKAPPSAYQVDRGLETPFTDEWTVGFERELYPEVALRVTYINRRFRKQLQDRDINHYVRYDAEGQPRDDIGAILKSDPLPGQPGTERTARFADNHPDLYIQNFFFNQILKIDNSNDARYTGIEVHLMKRLARRWQMDASYTYSRAVGAAESFLSILGNDPTTVQNEFGYLNYDQRHVVKLNGVTYLPHDWQLGGAVTWASGLPYSITNKFQSLDNFDYAQERVVYGYLPDRPDSKGRRELVPIRRNSERNDAVLDIDVRAQKAFVLGRCSSKLFLTVDNLLNSDALRIFNYTPGQSNFQNETDRNSVPRFEIEAERRFGRRFELGWQIEF